MTNAFRVENGILTMLVNTTTSSNAGIMQSGEYSLTTATDGSAIDYWNADDETAVYCNSGRSGWIDGTKITAIAGSSEKGAEVAVTLNTEDSTLEACGEMVVVNFTDSSIHNTVETTGSNAMIFMNNSSLNTAFSLSDKSECYSDELSYGNIYQANGIKDVAYMSGYLNQLFFYGTYGEANLGEYSDSTTVYGSQQGTQIFQDKGFNNLFIGRGNANNKVYQYGYNGLANLINATGINETHISGTNNATFEELTYTDPLTGKTYNYIDYLNAHEELKYDLY